MYYVNMKEFCVLFLPMFWIAHLGLKEMSLTLY